MNSLSGAATVHTISDLRRKLRQWRAQGERIGLVPTMGALHAGHLSLVETARRHAERVVVTIFVNPIQFGPTEDLAKYPRTLSVDLDKLASVNADLCFAPTVDEIYPNGFSTRVDVDGPAKAGLEDRFRPEHFAGVATIVAKLLNMTQADAAVFGEKDYQQLLVIEQMARDLNIATHIVPAPTLREADGLAMSSRNAYLSEEDRRRTPALYQALSGAAERIVAGEEIGHVMSEALETLVGAGFAIDYLEARNGAGLARVATLGDSPVRLLAAAKIGNTRLIDNVPVAPK